MVELHEILRLFKSLILRSECGAINPAVPDLGKSEKARNDLTMWASSFDGQQEILETIQDLEKKLEIARLV